MSMLEKTLFGAYLKKNHPENWGQVIEELLEENAVIEFLHQSEDVLFNQTAVVYDVDLKRGFAHAQSKADGETEFFDVKIEDIFYIRNSKQEQ